MSNSVFAPRHVYFPANEHKTTVIFLHDRNSTGPELAAYLAESSTASGETLYQQFPSTRWVLPSARAKHFYWTEEDRQQLSQTDKDNTTEWFQLSSLTDIQLTSPQQLASLQESASYILRIIDDEIALVGGDPEKVFLAGIGQGMALGLVVLLCIHHRLGGFVGLNGWMPFAETLSVLLERNQVAEAGGFFKSEFIAAAQQAYFRRRQQQQASSASPSPQPAEAESRVVVPTHVKHIPVFLGHSQRGTRPPKPELGTRALVLIKQMGFSQASWKIYPGREQGEETNDGDISKQLGGCFRDLGL
jgi:predicted esterase